MGRHERQEMQSLRAELTDAKAQIQALTAQVHAQDDVLNKTAEKLDELAGNPLFKELRAEQTLEAELIAANPDIAWPTNT